ncbi:uncharacterized protein LOC110851963 [Folsomia candida]|nr:uncharacterized protein LOC110851963 [Folsomia candida]
MPGGFQMETSQRLVDILLGQTEVETQKVLANHASCSPPVTIVEAFLRMFNGDQVSRIWKGLEPSAVDEQIAQGKTDDLKGYMAALRDLKLKKYDAIVKHCTEEIENPDASEENVLNARFLRGTMTFIWTLSSQTVEDFIKVTESPLASNKMKSSAYLKLAMRHTNTRHPFSKSDTIQTISEDYSKAEELWVENPDIYYHGSLLLVDRAVPLQGLDMLEMGIRFCAPETSIMMKTFFWTLQLTITNEDSVRNNAYLELKKLEHEFDSAECHEMFGQALMAAGGDERQAEYNEQFDKAIACNPQDPVFKIKKLIFRHWLGENGNLVKEDHALAEMDSFIETEGPNNLAYYHIGQMEILRGNAEKGLEALEKSIELTGSIHEIEARVAAKLEMIFYLRVNSRLKEEGLEDLADQLQNLTLKQPFP